jgi:hypothetical protein
MYVERPQADVSLASWEANGAGSDAGSGSGAAPIMDFRAVRATAPHHTLK